MKFLASLTILSAVTLCSCSTSDSPGDSPAPQAGNPLLGTWKFDSTASTVHTVALNANSGILGSSSDKSKEMLKLSEGSTVSFTGNTITMTVADGRSTSMEYVIKSQDANGNITIANQQGQESSYSVSGNKLISPSPELNFVGVYTR